MHNTVNLWAESGANLIGDDSQPTFVIENTSTGDALNLRAKAGAYALNIIPTGTGNASIAPVRLASMSHASAPLFEIAAIGGFVSCTSVVLTTVANTDYAIRVKVGGAGGERWIPLFKDAAIIGAAAF